MEANHGLGVGGGSRSCFWIRPPAIKKIVNWNANREDFLSRLHAHRKTAGGLVLALFYRNLETDTLGLSGAQVFTWHLQGPAWDLIGTESPPWRYLVTQSADCRVGRTPQSGATPMAGVGPRRAKRVGETGPRGLMWNTQETRIFQALSGSLHTAVRGRNKYAHFR